MSMTAVNKEDPKFKLNIKYHFITSNFWEFYVTEEPDEDGIGEAFVMGFENEIGSFSMEEVKGSIVSITEDLGEIMPPEGFFWR